MTQKIYINGKLYDKEDAKISVYDHGLLYGDGVFEGIRSYGGKVFRLAEHLDRLWESAKAIWLEIPMTQAEMAKAIDDTVAVNGIKDGYIRVVVTRGEGTLGTRSEPLQRSAGHHHRRSASRSIRRNTTRTGLEIITVSVMRNHPAALSPRIKSLNYLNNILAKIEGIQAGCIEALMLNHKGEVAECTGDNIFVVRRGELLTPPNDAGILEGVTRDAVIGLGPRGGHRSPRNAAHEARRLHRRRMLPDRLGRRSRARRQGRCPRRSATANPARSPAI